MSIPAIPNPKPFVPVRKVAAGSLGNQRLFPAIAEDGEMIWQPGDTDITAWPIKTIGWCHGGAGNRKEYGNLQGTVYLTATRAVVTSGHFVRGSRYRAYGFGSAVILAQIATKVAQARAQRASAGAYLTGQMRWPWLSRVIWGGPRAPKGSRGEIRLCGQTLTEFGDPETVMLLLQLQQPEHTVEVVRQVIAFVREDREAWQRTTDAERSKLAALPDPDDVDAPEGNLPSIHLAGGLRVSAASAGAGVYSTTSYPVRNS